MKNVGGVERLTRLLFGSSFVIADFFATIQFEIIFLLIGLWGVGTSALGYCPFNGLLGRNSCPIKLETESKETGA